MPVDAAPLSTPQPAGNMLQRGALWLCGQLQLAAGRTVRYRRQGVWGRPMTAVPSKRSYEIIDSETGIVSTVEMFDWQVRASVFRTLTPGKEPREGDSIVEDSGGLCQVYEVVPLGDRGCFEWLDSSGLMFVIHTQLIQDQLS